MRRERSLAVAAVAAAFTGAVPGTLAPTVSLQPGTVALGESAAIVVHDWPGTAMDVSLAGATDERGRPLGWRPAHRHGTEWWATMPRPALRGIYPILLRTHVRGKVVQSQTWLLRVFRRGSQDEPAFAQPTTVVRWWVGSVKQAKLVTFRRWPRPGFDRRDPRLHRLFVVAYNLRGRPGVVERRGMFITAVRDGYDGRWRLLEATVQP